MGLDGVDINPLSCIFRKHANFLNVYLVHQNVYFKCLYEEKYLCDKGGVCPVFQESLSYSIYSQYHWSVACSKTPSPWGRCDLFLVSFPADKNRTKQYGSKTVGRVCLGLFVLVRENIHAEYPTFSRLKHV